MIPRTNQKRRSRVSDDIMILKLNQESLRGPVICGYGHTTTDAQLANRSLTAVLEKCYCSSTPFHGHPGSQW